MENHQKVSHFNNFCPIKSDLSGNTVWQQASSFQKIAKIDYFCHFQLTNVHSECKRSSFSSQSWMRLFLWFSNTKYMYIFYRVYIFVFLGTVSLRSTVEIGMRRSFVVSPECQHQCAILGLSPIDQSVKLERPKGGWVAFTANLFLCDLPKLLINSQ